MLRNFSFLKVTEKNDLLKTVGTCAERKLAPIRKRLRYSESASLCEQKTPLHHFLNPQCYQDTTN